MFDIRESLNKWKLDLENNQSLNPSDIDELRLHLEDTIDGLKEMGLSQEEAFWIARHRLGDTEALSTEYAKVNLADNWKKRILWLLSGYFLIAFVSTIINLCLYPLHFVNIPGTIKTSLSGLDISIPILFYTLIFIITAGILFLLTSRKNVKGKNIVYRLCSPLEKKKYRFFIIVLGMYIFSFTGSALLPVICARIFEPSAFGSISIASKVFSILRSAFLIVLAGIFTFQLSRRKKKYEVLKA